MKQAQKSTSYQPFSGRIGTTREFFISGCVVFSTRAAMSDADIGSANIFVPAQGTSRVISNMNARRCASGSKLLLWNAVATVAAVTWVSHSFSSPARSEASLFCSSAGAPHTHF